MTDRVRIVLASASPRRRELLAQVGVECDVMPAEVDEVRGEGERPEEYVCRVAHAKAAAVAAAAPDAVVVAGDTEVVLDDDVLGKPRDAAAARDMLMRLAGRDHRVLSAVVVRRGERILSSLVPTVVRFRSLTEHEIAAYCATDEPYDKAGGYAIQGRAGAFVVRIDGSYSATVGLPLCETVEMIEALR